VPGRALNFLPGVVSRAASRLLIRGHLARTACMCPERLVARLRMPGAKTTGKDPWRQVVSEADRIPTKHLFTLQEGVFDGQFRVLHEAFVWWLRWACMRLIKPAFDPTYGRSKTSLVTIDSQRSRREIDNGRRPPARLPQHKSSARRATAQSPLRIGSIDLEGGCR
jgi:hypothetical protein